MADAAASRVVHSGGTLFAQRYRAAASRDAHADGCFVVGRVRQGFFCRPSCAIVLAAPADVRFFERAAAAFEAGLTPCPRCVPMDAPGTQSEAEGFDDLASRAERLIAAGVVAEGGVPRLAQLLGVTTRHVLRALTERIGVGPLTMARVARAHAAEVLLARTDLSIARVSAAAGFASIRQFNDTIAQLYGATPSQLRARRPSMAPESGALIVRLEAREPFDFDGLIDFARVRAVKNVETVDAASYARTVRLRHAHGWFRVTRAVEGGIECEIELEDLRDVGDLMVRVRRLFDLDALPARIDEVLRVDPALAPRVAATPGIRVPGAVDGDEILFRALMGQQVSVAAARTALGRLTDQLGESTRWGRVFPTADAIAEHGREVVRGPAKRVDAIIGAARALADGDIAIHAGLSRTQLTTELTALPGIGTWTAGYVAMRALGHPDVLLTSDLGIAVGARNLGLPDTPKELSQHARAWAPWRSYAGMHLWRAHAF